MADNNANTDQNRLIELGWLILNELDPADRRALTQARQRMLRLLRERFGQFDWRIPVVRRTDPVLPGQSQPVALLDEGVRERAMRHWDFVFVITRADLRSYYKPFAVATPSRAVNAAVISLARLSPEQTGDIESEEERGEQMTQRLIALSMHLLGDLTGLAHRETPEAWMHPIGSPDELDHMTDYSSDEREALAEELAEVADLRLEERPDARRAGLVRFYLRAAWIGTGDIWSAVRQAKPWLFPLRLGRLTAAALSALAILMITAEVWDLGMSQPPWRVAVLSLLSLTGTSAFILHRQRLLLRRGLRRGRRQVRITEQKVFTNVSVSIVVILGMLTTYLLLFALVLVLGLALYSAQLVSEWAAAKPGQVRLSDYLILAGFNASLGIVIGALGASFEGESYFRHITYVDEET